MASKKQMEEGATIDLAQVARLVGEVTALQINLDAEEAEQNGELDDVRRKHGSRIKTLQQRIAERTGLVEGWAESNKDTFATKRSLDFARGTIGFRLGQWQVKTRAKMTFKKVVEILKELPGGRTFLREREPDLDKESLIAARATLTTEQLTVMGVRIVQEETFYIEPKTEEATS